LSCRLDCQYGQRDLDAVALDYLDGGAVCGFNMIRLWDIVHGENGTLQDSINSVSSDVYALLCGVEIGVGLEPSIAEDAWLVCESHFQHGRFLGVSR